MKEKLMKKIKINKIDVISFFIFLIMAISKTLEIKFSADDELWDFSNIYKMFNGYVIYKDLNVIITPLFFYVGKIIFRIIGASYFSFRIYNVLIITSISYIIYIIFNKLKLKKEVSTLCTILIGTGFLMPFARAGANYNIMAMVLFLLGIYINIKLSKNNKWLPYLQGIITFLIFYTKQNIGIYYLIAGFFMHIAYIIKEKNIKNEIINYIKQVAIFIILITVAITSLYLKGNLYDFIDMCFLGIHDFASNNTKFEWFNLIIILVSILSIIYSCILLKLKIVTEEIKEINLKILPYIIIALLVMYPIFNTYHIYMATVPAIILFIGNIYRTFLSEIINEAKVKKICNIIIGIFTCIYIVIMGINMYGYIKTINTYINPYFGSKITEEQIENIKEITEYIKENNQNGIDVKIVSFTSNVYMNVLNKNNGKFDLPFHGNLGSKGEQGLIEQIKELNNCRILILKEERIFFQESETIRGYIKNNLKKDGEIGDYLIYVK